MAVLTCNLKIKVLEVTNHFNIQITFTLIKITGDSFFIPLLIPFDK